MFQGSYGEMYMQCEIDRRQAERTDPQETLRRALTRDAAGPAVRVAVVRRAQRWLARLQTVRAVYHPATGR